MSMTTREQLPATGRMQDFGDYKILGYADEDLRYNTGVLQAIARRIEMCTFGIERKYATEDVAFNFRNGGSMTVAVDSQTLIPFGYSTQRVLTPTLEGNRRRIMFTSTRAVTEHSQGNGVGPEILRFSFIMHGAPDIVAGIMGWAPPMIAYYKSGVVAELEGAEKETTEAGLKLSGDDKLDIITKQLAIVKLYPIFKRHDKSDLMAEALDYILKQSRYNGIPYDPQTGLMRGLWEKDSSMLFRAEKSSRRVEVIGRLLKDELGCDPTTGDAIVVMGPKRGWRGFVD